jgi:DnaJ-class molecular chaperone
VNIPYGFQKRLVRIKVPPGIRHGTVLRLKGMGRQVSGSEKGDLHLRVLIQKT